MDDHYFETRFTESDGATIPPERFRTLPGGPRVLDDGSIGERLLDHRWKTALANAPLRYDDLPPSIARQLRGYEETGNHRTAKAK
jgi:hypothetical protein